MKITKRQLRRIIKEERQKLINEMTPADMGMAAARMDDQRRDEINTDVPVPIELFDEIAAFVEMVSDLRTPGSDTVSKQATSLLMKMERELGIM